MSSPDAVPPGLAAALLEALPFPTLLLGPDAVVRNANGAALRLLGEPPAGSSFFRVLGPAPELAEARDSFLQSAASGSLDTSFDLRLPNDVYGSTRVRLRSIHGIGTPLVLAVLIQTPADVVLREVIDRLESQMTELGRIRHEISNPLMGLIGTAELLGQDPDLSEKARKRIATILGEGRRIKDRLVELDRLRER